MMSALLWLLLPIAALTGWWAARRDMQRHQAKPIPGHYLKGINYLLNEQPDKAIDLFVNVVDLDADTVETYIVLGNLLRRRGEVERAIRLHQNLIARPDLDDRTKADALLELARDYLKSGMFDRAEHLLGGVLDTGCHQLEALCHLREIYEQEKEWKKAIHVARNIEREGGGSQQEIIAQYYCELGENALETVANGNGEEQAVQHAHKALGHHRDCARAHIMLGDIASRRRDCHAAIRHYRDAYEKRPAFAPRIIRLIHKAYQDQGDLDGFRQFLHQARTQPHSLFPVLSLVEDLRQNGDSGLDEIFDGTFQSNPSSLVLLREYVEAITENRVAADQQSMRQILTTLDRYLADRPTHECSECQFQVHKLFWQCPSCQQWDTLRPIEPYAEKTPHRPYLV